MLSITDSLVAYTWCHHFCGMYTQSPACISVRFQVLSPAVCACLALGVLALVTTSMPFGPSAGLRAYSVRDPVTTHHAPGIASVWHVLSDSSCLPVSNMHMALSCFTLCRAIAPHIGAGYWLPSSASIIVAATS